MAIMWKAAFFMAVLVVCEARYFCDDVVSSHWQNGDQYTTVSSDFTDCGDDLCVCNETHANCSRHDDGLDFIPDLPPGITSLDFSRNALAAITRDDFFQNVSGLQSLDLSFNGLSFICDDAFQPLKTLNELQLIGNTLSYRGLHPVFSVSQLVNLDLRDNGLGPIPDGIFHRYPLPQLKQLLLDMNNINPFNMTNLPSLVSLRVLGMDMNNIREIYTDYSPNLERLSLEFNAISRFPDTCENHTSLFPKLRGLFLGGNILESVGERVCLPSVRTLFLGRNRLSKFPADMFSVDSFPSLQFLGVNRMTGIITGIADHAFDSPVLKCLSLYGNNIEFSHGFLVKDDAFSGCRNLSVLHVGLNDFSRVDETRFVKLFGKLSRLVFLDLQSVGLSQISSYMFEQFGNLQILILQNNKLVYLPDGVFASQTGLHTLSMSKNQISVVQETAFTPDNLRSLSHLDISGNPFYCSCQLRWFRRQLLSDPHLFRGSQYEYRCANLPDTAVQNFYVADQACLLSRETSILIIVIVVLLMSSLSVTVALYRYRWHIRLVLYEAFRGQGDRWRRLQEQHFQYDVFVSYDSEDELWVQQHLMPELEERLGLRLCLHERDFIPGKNIVDNIVHCVQNSKKVMMLFSTNFSQSPWCQFELNLCLSHVMENDDMLLVVLLEDIPSRDLTPAMMAVMKTTTYIEWDDHPEARASFWGRLQLGLHEVMSDV